MSKLIIAADPGISGGIAVIHNSKLVGAWKTPTLAGKFDKKGTAELIIEMAGLAEDKDDTLLFVERAAYRHGDGGKGAFTSGNNFAVFEIAALLHDIRYIEVTATVWKKSMRLTDNKEDSIKLCQQLFPQFPIPKGTKYYHDGVAEAILLAEYARRKGY